MTYLYHIDPALIDLSGALTALEPRYLDGKIPCWWPLFWSLPAVLSGRTSWQLSTKGRSWPMVFKQPWGISSDFIGFPDLIGLVKFSRDYLRICFSSICWSRFLMFSGRSWCRTGEVPDVTGMVGIGAVFSPQKLGIFFAVSPADQ